MNKVQLAEKVYEMHTQKGIDVSKKHAEEVVDFVFDTIAGSLKKGEEVAIAGFGAFAVKRSAARTARNPRTGEVVQVAASNKPKFRAAKALKELVK
ncbi:MAG: HU family DNA-binding protein [Patescibacteria group bacterium]